MLGLLPYFWRLVPGNPILLRVVGTASKRKRDLAVRCGYLGVLIAVVVYALVTQLGAAGGGSLTALNKASGVLFQQLSYLQLGLVALLAPVFTAGAITQERDSQTYDILLSTPLTNGQIVLGTLLSRVFFVVALLVSGVPVFSITQVFGGVSIGAIVMSFLIAASTAMVTGALAIAIATLKVGSRRTILGFYLFIAAYLVGGALLDQVGGLRPVLLDGTAMRTSWVTGLHPFLALKTVFGVQTYVPPDVTLLPEGLRRWPVSWYLTSPAGFYVTAMLGLSFALVVPSIVLLRRLAQTSVSPWGWLAGRVVAVVRRSVEGGEGETRAARSVWSNPIAWREAKTKGSATRAVVVRWGFFMVGALAAGSLLVGYVGERSPERFTSPGAWDREAGTLLIYDGDTVRPFRLPAGGGGAGAGGVLVVRMLDERGQVRERGVAAIDRRMEVTEYQFTGNVLTQLTVRDVQRRIPLGLVRQLLVGLVLVQAAAVLLIVTNAAASTVTREKEDGTLDLLLTTPITSHYYIWGKLRGLVMFVLPLIAVPTLTVAAFVVVDGLGWLSGDLGAWAVLPESVVLVPLVLVVMSAFAAIVGMHMSLRCKTTVRAVMFSVGTVAGVVGLLGFCGDRLLGGINAENFLSLGVAAFSPFTVLMLAVDPFRWGGAIFVQEHLYMGARLVLVIFGVLSAGVYAGVVYSLYRGMVKNFDMTIRKQSR